MRAVAAPPQHRLVALACQDDATRIPANKRVRVLFVFSVQIAAYPHGLHAEDGSGRRKFSLDVRFQLPFVLQFQPRAGGHGHAAHGACLFQRHVARRLGPLALALNLPDDGVHPHEEGKGRRQHHEQRGRRLPILADRAAMAGADGQHQAPGGQHDAGKQAQRKQQVEIG
ncbi:hypothetical protein D3C71_1556160 [compost metagenome]